ncbi:uncharacterized protein [Nicotiana tomentosiformis]|uniref:uncharacterized protein n=1 Tax=Nicotiana tomentosiformis TaxID=4098 RepID=UPI00388CB481
MGLASEWFIDQDISHWHVWDDMAQAFVKQFQYNIDIAPDHNSLSNMKKKPTESFREYVIKWREQAARVKPPMDNHELIIIFLEAQEPDYFQNMMSAMGRPFAEAIKIGEMVEIGLKIGRIVSQTALKATTQAIQNGSGSLANRKKRDEGSMMTSGSREIQRGASHPYVQVQQGQSSYPQHYYPLSIPQYYVGPPQYTVFYAQSYDRPPNQQKLKRMGVIGPIAPHYMHPDSHGFQANAKCDYHSGAPGHSTDDCWTLKRAIERLIAKKLIIVTNGEDPPNVTNNMLPAHNDVHYVGMIGRDQEYKLVGRAEMTVGTIQEGTGPELRKTPAQISLLSLLIHSEEHSRVLIKILNEAHVSEKTTVNQLEKMANRFFEVNRIFFTDDELPEEGAGHNRALHLIVKCEGNYVKQVMVDRGSSVDVCPLTTMQSMKINTDRIRLCNVCIQAFDGSARDTIGEINLTMTIGPEGCESIVYQAFEVVVVDHVEEGKPILHPCLSAIFVMMVALMMRQGYEPGKGLGASLQQISEPISLFNNKGRFSLGFRPTQADEDKAKHRKKHGWDLQQLIPRIFYTFVKPRLKEGKNSSAHANIDEIFHGLSQMLSEVNMIKAGEGTSRADMQLIGPDTMLNNWKATPLPTRKKSCFVNAGFNNMTCMRNSRPDLKKLSNFEIMHQEVEYDENEVVEEIKRELEQFENKPRPNLNETEPINIRGHEEVRETKISIHAEQETRDALIQILFEYIDVFAWSYDDMPGLSSDLVVHKLPTYPNFPPIQQKQRKFKMDMSDNIKEEIMKQLSANVVRAVRYTTWWKMLSLCQRTEKPESVLTTGT